jgi:hypothetical protein
MSFSRNRASYFPSPRPRSQTTMSMGAPHNQGVAHIICRGSEGVQGGFNVFSQILIHSNRKPHRVLFSGMLGISYPPPTPNLCGAGFAGDQGPYHSVRYNFRFHVWTTCI